MRLNFSRSKTRTWMIMGLAIVPTLAIAQSANRLKAIDLVKQAATVYQSGDMTSVIKICRQAVGLDPTYPRAYTWMGAAFQKRGNHDDACAAFWRAAKLAPGTADSQRAARGIRELGCGGAAPIVGVASASGARLENRWSAPLGIGAVSFSSDGQHLSGAGVDGAWSLWQVPSGHLDNLVPGEGPEAVSAASSPNFYAVGLQDGGVRLFNAFDNRSAGRLDVRAGSATGLAYSRDGRFLALVGTDGALKIYDGRSNVLLRQIPSDGLAMLGVAFSPDSRFVAMSIGTQVRIYATGSGKLLHILNGDGLPMGVVAWSHGGPLLAAADGYKIRVWDSNSGHLLRVLSGHRLAVSALAFGMGALLASGGYDSQLKLWNASTGANIGNLQLHSGQIRSLSFDNSGKRLASSDQSGLVGLWHLP